MLGFSDCGLSDGVRIYVYTGGNMVTLYEVWESGTCGHTFLFRGTKWECENFIDEKCDAGDAFRLYYIVTAD